MLSNIKINYNLLQIKLIIRYIIWLFISTNNQVTLKNRTFVR